MRISIASYVQPTTFTLLDMWPHQLMLMTTTTPQIKRKQWDVCNARHLENNETFVAMYGYSYILVYKDCCQQSTVADLIQVTA